MFEDFVKYFNEEMSSDVVSPVDLGLNYAFQRHFSQARQEPGLRMSNLGKPAMINALQKLGYIEPEPKGSLLYTFWLGDVFEKALGIFMSSYGYEVVTDQTDDPDATKVEWGGITGHYDFKVTVNGQPVIVEAKTMSGNYSRVFQKCPNDDRGYLTQLALYSAATKLPATWLCLDKGSGRLFEVVPDANDLLVALQRAENVLRRLEKVEEVSDILKHFQAPPARPEVFQKRETGKFLVPQSMAYSPYVSVVYKLTDSLNNYGKPTTYVDGPADVEHMETELDRLVKTGALLYV